VGAGTVARPQEAHSRVIGVPARGRFVTFEGIEGSGKSTQIVRLAERLRALGRSVLVTREPGGTEIGGRLRGILLDPSGPSIDPVAEMLLYAADRAQHLAEIVEPALACGEIVLCDRYLDATLAYQGYGRELGCEFILEIHRRPPLDRRPDRTVLLDLDPATGVTRALARDAALGTSATAGRFEAEALAFHERVREGYLLLAEQEPARFVVLDGSGTPEQIADRVWQAVRGALDR